MNFERHCINNMLMWSTKLNFLGKEQWDCEIVSDITLPLQQNNFTSVLKYPGLQNVLNFAITILNLVDPLATNDAIWCRDFGCMLSVGGIWFDNSFCASKNCGIEGGG